MRKHSKWAASASERWTNCPGSVPLSEKMPPSPENVYAKEGTDAHFCLETIFEKHPKHTRVARETLYDTFPKEMVDHAYEAYVEIVRRAPEGATIQSETRADLSFIQEGMFGTFDAAIIEEFGLLEVIDFKYGAGIPVDPDENMQMIFYALGIAKKYDYNFSTVRLTIIQPRAEHAKGPVRSWDITVKELCNYITKFSIAVEASLQDHPPFKAGSWCRWCPGAAVCPEISKKSLSEARIVFAPENPEPEPVVLPALSSIDPKKLSKVLSAAEKIETWIAAVRAHAFQTAQEGKKIPGWKLVQKRSIRKWTDVDQVAPLFRKMLGSEAFSTPELLSPAQMEKTVKRVYVKEKGGDKCLALIAENVTNESSGLTLVDDSDPREEYNSIQKAFGKPEEKEVSKISKPKTKEKKSGKQSR